MKEAFKDVFGYTDSYWDVLKQLLKNGIDIQYQLPTVEHGFHLVLQNCFDSTITCNLIAVLGNMKRAFASPLMPPQYKNYIVKNIPHCCAFYLPWIEGYYKAKENVSMKQLRNTKKHSGFGIWQVILQLYFCHRLLR